MSLNIIILQEKLHERAKSNVPVFEDYKCIRSPGDTSTLDDLEAKCLTELVGIHVYYSICNIISLIPYYIFWSYIHSNIVS